MVSTKIGVSEGFKNGNLPLSKVTANHCIVFCREGGIKPGNDIFNTFDFNDSFSTNRAFLVVVEQGVVEAMMKS